MARDEERSRRAREIPLVEGLSQAPGIVAILQLRDSLRLHLTGLADELLVKDYPGSTLLRAERELIACAVSAANDCFFCMDTHGMYAQVLLERSNVVDAAAIVDEVKTCSDCRLGRKFESLLHIARVVTVNSRALTKREVEQAKEAGATDADVQVTILITSMMVMYNRMVDGFRSCTPDSPEAYRERAQLIVEHGYTKTNATYFP